MMKTLQHILLVCLLLVAGFHVLAQQGNVAAGGDAAGAGGSMSYSIGQTGYLYIGSENGSVNFGLQQTWLSSLGPPPLLEISDMQIGNAQCFNASETVIVAGDGNEFIVLNGGFAEIIAGHNIILKFGTKVEHGGSLYAHISNIWCEPVETMLAAINEEPLPEPLVFGPAIKNSYIRIYPNPGSGIFTLEVLQTGDEPALIIEVYSMLGESILHAEFPASSIYKIDLSSRQPGMYIVRVIRGQEMDFVKVVKH